MSGRPAATGNLPPVRQTASIAEDFRGMTEITAVSLSARERRTLSCIADELADSAPELASLLSVFNRLTSGEEMPGRRPAGNPEKCEHQRSRRSRRRIRTRRQASHGRQRVRLAIAALTLISVAMIVVVLVLSHTGHEAGGNGRCGQSWPMICLRR